ncbi:MAG: glycosyltransferase family 2 protein [Chloroflexaceae bacterium]|nr:glycosyltransferase family 2 protein [Chloroflexaceae bacterium]
MQTLAIILVSWNVCDRLRTALQAIDSSFHGSGIRYTTLVVDNASNDGTATMVRSEFPHVHLLEPGYNAGFAAGNNLALRTLGFGSEGRCEWTPWVPCGRGAGGEGFRGVGQSSDNAAIPAVWAVMLLNPDTKPLGDALPRLVAYLASNPSVLAVGPQLRYADGSIQSSRRRFPTRGTFFWESTSLERWWPRNPWVERYRCAERNDDTCQHVDWLVGAALLVRGSAIARAGLLDEGFFLYSEEIEWQQRLRHANHPDSAIVYLPDAIILHYEAQSSGQVPAAHHLHFQRSRIRLARLWYGQRFAVVLRLFLLLTYIWECALESVKWLLGHRRSLRQQRIAIYTSVLRSRLYV